MISIYGHNNLAREKGKMCFRDKIVPETHFYIYGQINLKNQNEADT